MPLDDMPREPTAGEPDPFYEEHAQRFIEEAGGELIRGFTEHDQRRFIVRMGSDWTEIVGAGDFFMFAAGARFAARNLVGSTR